MPKINQNLIGRQYGHLTVIGKSSKRGKQHQYLWVCQCDCGKKVLESTSILNAGEATSCGHVRLKRSKENLKYSQARHLTQLNDRPPVNNRSGYRNIMVTTLKSGKTRYRVSVVYDHKQHSKQVKTLEEALDVREQLREKWWPNYKSKQKSSKSVM